MYKLLIVDDEQIEREGLKAMLQKPYPQWRIDLAKNGADALDQVRREPPALILMDIKMPGMSGLEAVEKILAEYPDMKFIMVTAYEMFDYAQSAIRLGVKDYLLKPSRPSEIVKVVGRVIEEIVQEGLEKDARLRTERTLGRMMPVIESDVVTQLIYDHIHEVDLEERVALLGGDVRRQSFAVLLSLDRSLQADAFCAAVRRVLKETGNGWAGARSDNQLPLILFRESGLSYRAQASMLVRRLLELQQPGATVRIIGIGRVCDSLAGIRASYHEALIATADSDLPSKHRFYEDMPAIGELREDYPSKQEEQQYIDRIRLGQWSQVEAAVMDFASRCEKRGLHTMQAGQRVLEWLWVAYRVLTEMGVEARRPAFSFRMQDYRQLRAEASVELGKLIRCADSWLEGRDEPHVVSSIQQYIVDHSHEDLSLERIAAEFRLSPYYVSKMFKEETGVNYIEFLTERRMEKAREMLLDPALTLKEVAYEIGYHDPNYFSKVFKKSSGVSPSDYRKKMRGKKV